MPPLVTTLVALLAALQAPIHAEPRVGGRDLDRTGLTRPVASLTAGTPSVPSYTYGETASDPSSQYNGRVFDPGTGFHDYGARMYWPQIGRFISADSYQGDIGNPASLNRYSYVLNNPYKYTDPSGHMPVAIPIVIGWKTIAAGVAALGTAVAAWFVIDRAVEEYEYQRASDLMSASSVQSTQNPEDAVCQASDSAPTSRAARREAMRQAGIPTSQQPVSQSQDEAGTSYDYRSLRQAAERRTCRSSSRRWIGVTLAKSTGRQAG